MPSYARRPGRGSRPAHHCREPAETQDQYPTWADIFPEGTRKFDGYVSQDALDDKRWRFEFDPAVHLNTDDLDLIFQEEEENDQRKNHRTYIGPDSDTVDRGSDKIPVEVRYNNNDNRVTFSGPIAFYKKTTFVQYAGKEWKRIKVPIYH